MTKFLIFLILEIPFISLFFYVCYLALFKKSVTFLSSSIAIICALFIQGIFAVCYNNIFAKMFDKSSINLYKITPASAKKIGILFISIAIIWLMTLLIKHGGLTKFLSNIFNR